MKLSISLYLPLFFCFIFSLSVQAADPWPAETWQESTKLTSLDPEFTNNLSGAHWNPNTRTLWVCLNGPGKFWALVEDNDGSFVIDEDQDRNLAKWYPGGDLEGITQVDLDEPSVYVMVEGEDKIRKYDVSDYGRVSLLQEWNIKVHVPTSGGLGSEGITFVPDDWLDANGFVDQNGNPYTSVNGMGGLMFVAHQNGGGVYAFDLDPAGDRYTFVGRYWTSRGESSGLEFDRSAGILYIWHNTDSNFLELTDLSSVGPNGQKRFNTHVEYIGPRSGNLEGIAITPISSNDHWIFITDDDNQNGAALMWYDNFSPDIELPIQTTEVRVSSGNDDAEEKANGSMSLTSTDLELVQESSQQTIGIRFASLDVPAHATITKATIQFTVDEAASGGTALTIYGEASGNSLTYTSAAQNITSRAKTRQSVQWNPQPWNIVGASGEDQQTPDLTAIVQEIISQDDWTSGNPVAFVITGVGKRVAESYNGVPALAPLLHVEYSDEEYVAPELLAVEVIDVSVSSSDDDAEEKADGSMSLTSSDLELVQESSQQTIGIRFDQVDVPEDAIITSASIQFTVDEVSAGEALLDIRGELSSDSQPFSSNQGDISSRYVTLASVHWVPQEWGIVGQAIEKQRTENISSIVQEIIGLDDWISGNPMTFIITGSGKRVAESYNGAPNLAPRLHIEYQLSN